MTRLNVLLRGIVGSTAYGLAHSKSDVDRAAVFAVPGRQLLGLADYPQTVVTRRPDLTTRELGQFCQLALNGNPSVIELMWLPEDCYEHTTPIGLELIALRQAFLSRDRARAAYLGYAQSQKSWFLRHVGGETGGERQERVAKHARHFARLLIQGLALYSTGQLTVRLSAPEADFCWDFGRQMVLGHTDMAEVLLADFEGRFAGTRSPLPVTADAAQVDAWVRDARLRLMAEDQGYPDVIKQGGS